MPIKSYEALLGSLDRCSHNRRWGEFCAGCRIVSLRESLAWMEPQVQRDRAELEILQRSATS